MSPQKSGLAQLPLLQFQLKRTTRSRGQAAGGGSCCSDWRAAMTITTAAAALCGLATGSAGIVSMGFSRQSADIACNTTLASLLLLERDGFAMVQCVALCAVTPTCATFVYDQRKRSCSLLGGGFGVNTHELEGSSVAYVAVAGKKKLDNAALYKAVTMSSYAPLACEYCCDARCLVDSNISTVAQTADPSPGPHQWMAVNLGEEHLVVSVAVTSRIDCCSAFPHCDYMTATCVE